MRLAQLRARTLKMFRPCAKARSGPAGVVKNLQQQGFQPLAPNRCWAGAITYIRTTAGWLYLPVWIDLFSRRVVDWKLDLRMNATLVIEALNRALGHRRVEHKQLLVHTNQGSQYRATDYRNLLQEHGLACSMSAKGRLLGQRGGGEFLLHPQTGV